MQRLCPVMSVEGDGDASFLQLQHRSFSSLAVFFLHVAPGGLTAALTERGGTSWPLLSGPPALPGADSSGGPPAEACVAAAATVLRSL